jgi:hypothetical protein
MGQSTRRGRLLSDPIKSVGEWCPLLQPVRGIKEEAWEWDHQGGNQRNHQEKSAVAQHSKNWVTTSSFMIPISWLRNPEVWNISLSK